MSGSDSLQSLFAAGAMLFFAMACSRRGLCRLWGRILVLVVPLPPVHVPVPGTVQSCLRCNQSELVPRCRFEGLADGVIGAQLAELTHHTTIRDLLV